MEGEEFDPFQAQDYQYEISEDSDEEPENNMAETLYSLQKLKRSITAKEDSRRKKNRRPKSRKIL